MSDELEHRESGSKADGRQSRWLVDSTAIFFSVLLAFFVEQWREDQNEQREAESAMSLVRAELRENLAELERSAPERLVLRVRYEEAMEKLRDEGVFPQNMPNFTPPKITTIAYDLATDSGAVTTVPAQDLLIIARAYEALERVKRNELFLTERNAQIRFNDAEQYISGFIYYHGQASSNEPVAIEQVKLALDRLGAPSEA